MSCASSVPEIWGVQSLVLLGRFGGLSVLECSTVPQMNCRLAVSFTTRPGNHTNEGSQPGLRAVTKRDNSGRLSHRSLPAEVKHQVLSTFISRTKDFHFCYTVKRGLWQAGWGWGVKTSWHCFSFSLWMANWIVSAVLLECLSISAPLSPLAISF